MLTKRLGSGFRRHLCKYLSTAASPNIQTVLPEETEITKENAILREPDYFKVHNLFTVTDLFKAKVHYGHKIASLHHNMKPFVFGARLGHVIFDLDITAYHLREALNFAAHMAYRDGIILFVSKNPEMTILVERTAKNCGEFALTREFLLGLFTDQEKKFNTYIRLPDLVIVLNTLEENGFQHSVIVEAAKMCIPTVGIVDSNCNPNLITYPVPGNDDSYSCFELYCSLFERAIMRGKAERQKDLMAAKAAGSNQKNSEINIETVSRSIPEKNNTESEHSNEENVQNDKIS